MRFTSVGGTVTLEQAGNRATGTIGLGYTHLAVRSDQTWVADDLAYVSMFTIAGYRSGDGSVEREANPLVGSIDGGRLDNLGEVNLQVYATRADPAASEETATPLLGGTYGSIYTNGRGNNRIGRLNLKGEVNLVGNAVQPDATNGPSALEYSLALNYVNGGPFVIHQNGHTLNLTNGLRILEAGGPTYRYGYPTVQLDAEGSTLHIGGNVLIESVNGGPEAAFEHPQDGGGRDARPNPTVGIYGGSGAAITVGGNWEVKTISMNNAMLSNSTLSMIGGTELDPATFEVADNASLTGVQSDSWSIDTLNIGDGTNPAYVQLVNDHINDNPVTGDAALDKIGEKLIVDTLNIHADAVLDINGQVVEIGPSTLSIDVDGLLDLNLGDPLADQELVSQFIGLGDQTAVWDSFVDQVIDSSNPDFVFEPFYSSSEDVTQWRGIFSPQQDPGAVIPEPMTALLVLAGLGLTAARRRR
jgi:hypothetical protein